MVFTLPVYKCTEKRVVEAKAMRKEILHSKRCSEQSAAAYTYPKSLKKLLKTSSSDQELSTTVKSDIDILVKIFFKCSI